MPIYIPEHIVFITCKNCGFQKRVKRGGYGDVVGRDFMETIRFLRDKKNIIEQCPLCGSTDIEDEIQDICTSE